MRRHLRDLAKDQERASRPRLSLAEKMRRETEVLAGKSEYVFGGKTNSWLVKALKAEPGSPMRNRADRILRDELRKELVKQQLLIPAVEAEKPVAYICNVPLYKDELAATTNVIELLTAKLELMQIVAGITKAQESALHCPCRVIPPLKQAHNVRYDKPPAEAPGEAGDVPVLPGDGEPDEDDGDAAVPDGTVPPQDLEQPNPDAGAFDGDGGVFG